MKSVVKAIIEILPAKAIVLLNGDLGTGKTTLVRLIAEFNSMQNVQSPSFAIHNYYFSSSGAEIHHFDLYRVYENPSELESVGLFDLLAQNQGWAFIEWGRGLNQKDLGIFAPLFQINLSINNQNPNNRDFDIASL
jgi:tRNA threonylcarbamoyladenosine biosynthesis protein TsaE